MGAVTGGCCSSAAPASLELLGVQPAGGRRDGRRRPTCAVTACPGAGSASRRPAASTPGGSRGSGSGSPAAAGQRDHARPRRAARSPPRRRAAARVRTFAEASSIAHREHRGRLQLVLTRRRARRAQRPGTMCSTIASSAASFSAGSSIARAAAEQHRRAVVGRVVHRRAREHQAVEQRHGQARGAPSASARSVRLAAEPCR